MTAMTPSLIYNDPKDQLALASQIRGGVTFQKALIRWFHKNARQLPWRKAYIPYEVWVSEIMLQQTQVETALPYYQRWLKTFPNIATLAKSDEKKVLKLWQGLGYYSRARNIHESAKYIVEKYHGAFPEKFEDILSLKGIGRYSAGAIASIAFNQEKPIVDGNVLRVLSRVFLIDDPIDVEKNKAQFWELQEKLIPKGEARFFNQALMELGALVCSTKNPACALCPVRNFCGAYKKDSAENYPVRQKRKKIVKVSASAVVLRKNEKYLLRRRPLGQIMGGLWEFPEWKLDKNRRIKPEESLKKTKSLIKKEFSFEPKEILYLGSIKRNYTYFNENLDVFLSEAGETEIKLRHAPGWLAEWLSEKDFKNTPFSSAHSKIAKLVSQNLSIWKARPIGSAEIRAASASLR